VHLGLLQGLCLTIRGLSVACGGPQASETAIAACVIHVYQREERAELTRPSRRRHCPRGNLIAPLQGSFARPTAYRVDVIGLPSTLPRATLRRFFLGPPLGLRHWTHLSD